jgi:hypothetical protein
MSVPDFSSYPKTKAEARALGQTYYFSGCVCPHGHNDLRTAHRGECRRCHTIRSNKWMREHGQPGNREHCRLYAWKQACKRALEAGRPFPPAPA